MPSRSIIININSNENTIQNTDVAAMDSCVSQYGHRVADMSYNFPVIYLVTGKGKGFYLDMYMKIFEKLIDIVKNLEKKGE